MKLSLPLKWFGGKFYLAPKIRALMPPHTHYVEPYFGGGAVLLSAPAGRSELVNDINGDLINFWRVLQSTEKFAAFIRYVQAVPMARAEWDAAADNMHDETVDDIGRAAAFFVWCRQSYSGNMKGFTVPTRTRLRREMNGNVSEWVGAVDGLPALHDRLRRVFIENMPAVPLIKREDTPGTLFYLDPPYLHDTRTTKDGYAFEMTPDDHAELLATINTLKGKVMLSGYPSAMYDGELAGWTRHTFDLPNNAAGGESKRRMTEVVWCNF